MITCAYEDGNKANLRHVNVEALVVQNSSILLIKRADFLREAGKWALLGGYVEFGESIRDAVEREVFEESGYKITNVNFFTYVDNLNIKNDINQNLGMVFVTNPLEKVAKPGNETADLKWFDFNNLPKEDEIAFDHLQIINLYLKTQNLSFPVLTKY